MHSIEITHSCKSFATLKWYNVKFHIVHSFMMNGLVVKCPQLNAFDFCCFIHPHINGQYQSVMFMNHLFYDHGFEGLFWKWTNNVFTIFHWTFVFFILCLQVFQMQVGLSWCSQNFLVGAHVLKNWSHVLKPYHEALENFKWQMCLW